MALSIGVNYYHQSMGYGSPTSAQIIADMDALMNITDRIKIYHNPYTNNGGITTGVSLAWCQEIAAKAIERGMGVTWVVNVDNSGGYLTDANWSDYVSKVQAEAGYAEAAGCDEFFVGNEIYAHNNGDAGFTDLPTRIKSLISVTNFSGVKSYEMIASELSLWAAAGISELQRIALNIYSTESSFQSIVQSAYNSFGAKLEIGEWSIEESGFEQKANSSKNVYGSLLARRKTIMQNIGVQRAYLFTWRSSQTTVFNAVLSKNDTYPNGALNPVSYVNGTIFNFYMNRAMALNRNVVGTKIASSLYFGLTDAVVTVNDSNAYKSLTALTVEAFIKIGFAPSVLHRIMDCQIGTNVGFNFELNTGRLLQANIGNGTITGNVQASSVVPLPGWHHVAVSWDGSTMRLFIDGVVDGTTTALSGGNTGNPTGNFYIGNSVAGNRGFPGLIQELRVSNVARYTGTFTPPTTRFVKDSNTVVLFHMDENTGTTITDSSDSGLSGTFGGVTTPKWSLGYLNTFDSTLVRRSA